MNPVSDNIIAKIQKLLALGSSSNEAEATSAMNFAQALLAKHNLDANIISSTRVEGGTVTDETEKRERTKISRSAKLQWQRDLWRAIAEANFCWYSVIEIREGKRGVGKVSAQPVKRHCVLGRESNVISVRIMGEYLEDVIERMLPYANHERMSRSALSWKAGCADRLRARVIEQAEERKRKSDQDAKDSGDGKSMILRSVYEKEYAANYDARNGAGAHARYLASSAEWEAGREQREKEQLEQEEKAELEWLEYLKSESPQAKKEREREEAKEQRRVEAANRRYARSYHRERRSVASKLDYSAYDAGSKVGETIGIGEQLGAKSDKSKSKQIA